MLSQKLKAILKTKTMKMRRKMKVMNWNQQQLQLKEKEELSINRKESFMHQHAILELWTLTILQDTLLFLSNMLSSLKCKTKKKGNLKKVSKSWEACNLSKNLSTTSSDKEKMNSNFLRESKLKVINNKMLMINNKHMEIKLSNKRKRKFNNLKGKLKISN